MDRYLIYQSKSPAPATHAIVLGVGDYPFLLGGSKTLSTHNDGMGQLSSPPISARTFATWLIDSYHNPSKPLDSVALLLSESPSADFVNPKTGDRIRTERASYDHVASAIQDWAGRGAENPDNLLIFYFCGHGVSEGAAMSLLMSEYGDNPNTPLDQAFDFGTFRLKMSRNPPSQQIYFVDACRASSDTLIRSLDFVGRVPVQVGRQSSAETPIYYASLAGDDAFGKTGQVSFFTDALLKGLNGMGSDNPEGDWRVTTTRLKEAIDYEVRRAVESGLKRKQVPATDALTTFEIHHLPANPEVPVIVTCRPDSENAIAEFVCTQQGVERDRRPPMNDSWTITLPAGSYHFSATLPVGTREPIDRPVHVRPVYRKVIIDV